MGARQSEILCIGSVLWDVIGRSDAIMRVGSDVPGRINRLPGGVALNIAMMLRRFGVTPILLSAVGEDAEGNDLIETLGGLGLVTDHVYRARDLPTDRYMAVEGANGLIAAIADAHSLEAAGDRILHPLSDGTLGAEAAPYPGMIALDGNLTAALLDEIATSPLFRAADLRVAPASPGKADRLRPFLACPNATLYVNLEEANLLLQTTCTTAEDAARALRDLGAMRVLVTDGPHEAVSLGPWGLCRAAPPPVTPSRITGAGDTFMAAHMAFGEAATDPQAALERALSAAAAYVSGKDPA